MPTEGTGEPPKSFGGRPPEVSLLWFPRGGAEGHFHSYRPLPGLSFWERDKGGWHSPKQLISGLRPAVIPGFVDRLGHKWWAGSPAFLSGRSTH